ncbi:MAG TPA: superoxide dismutase, partial [Phenylobacterium sp.]|nr:superoxide dismutase [Phenylobacterium sp.]
MTEPTLDRRMLLGGVALAGAVAATSVAAQTPPPAAPAYAPQPLPFDPKAVAGLSEKLLVSHHDNNYVGAVKRLGAIRAEFGKLDPATAPVF